MASTPGSGKNFRQKQNSPSKSSNSGNKTRKVSNGMSLFSMWKIQNSQKSITESSDDEFLPPKNFKGTPKKVKASPTKRKISPKPWVCKTNPEPKSTGQDQDLEFCPNCQMPFAALIKQSQNWHLTECMDFDFQCLKECPMGESCSSTIPRHYMRYTHYGLARIRSGIPTTESPPSKKLNLSISSGKIKMETLRNSFSKQGGSVSQSSSPSTLNPWKNVSFSDSDVKNVGNNELSVCKSTCSNTSPNNSANRAEEKGKQSQGMFSHVTKFFSEQGKNSSHNALSRCSTPGILAKSSSDCNKSFQESKTCDSVPLKTHSPGKISSSEVEKKQSESKQSTRRVLSDMFQTSSITMEELNCSLNSVSDSEMYNESLSDPLDSAKDVISGVRRNIKCIKLNNGLSCASDILQSGDETEGVDEDLNDKILYQSSTRKGKQLDFVSSKMAGDVDTSVNVFHEDLNDIFDLAYDWFPHAEFDTGDATERNSVTNDVSEEKLFNFKDASDVNRKTMKQTVITETSSTSKNSLNVILPQVQPKKLTPQKKPKTALQPKSPGKTELFASPGKKQTSLMSFFKSSTSHALSTQKMTFAEPTSTVKNDRSNPNNWRKIFPPRKRFNIEQQEQNTCGKKCPYYKKIPGTTFAVDAFSYGNIPGIQHYFLSHFHYDHYMGLTKSFQHPVYCSVVTAKLVSMKIRLPQKNINILQLNETAFIENVAVTVLDANHCPGSVMFLFGLPDGKFILHTGDFRTVPAMELYPQLRNCRIERLFLDTTYCNPMYDFPSQDSILDLLKSLVVPRMKNNPKLLVVCGSYTIGKERAFMAIAESIDCKIWAEPWKRSILNCLEDHRISSRLVTNQNLAKIHVCPMRMINISSLRQHLVKFHGIFDEIIGLKPTGWENASSASKTVFSLKPTSQGPVTIYGVPYSEHSSFSELKKFVQFLNPKYVFPTVNVGNAQCRNQMAMYFKQWLR